MATPLLARATRVTKPGIYDMDADTYHADPVPNGSLSSSGARLLMPPGCPALFRYRLDNPEPPKRHFDLGHAAHQLVLGAGPRLVVIDASDYRTKAAQAQRDAAHAAGAVPLLTHEHEQVKEMAAALRRHPDAARLFDPEAGSPEQSLFWVDKPSGVWLRARLDWLPNPRDGRMIVADYKTAARSDLAAIQRAVADHGYHLQAPWYLDAVQALGLGDEDTAFVFVFQEKTPPYLVTVVELDATALHWGRILNRSAIDRYRRCVETGIWPGYSDDVALITLPGYTQSVYEAAYERGDYDTREDHQ